MRDHDNEGWTTRDEALVAQNDAGTGFLLRRCGGLWLEESEADEQDDAEALWAVTDETGCWLLFPEDEADEDEGAPSAPGGFVWVAAER